MIILGILLVVIFAALFYLGVILVIIGAVFFVLGAVGHPAGRNHYW